MRRVGGILLSFWALLSVASAEEPPRERGRAGVSLGYGFPAGGLEHGSDLSDLTYGSASLAAEAAFRLNPSFSVGAGLAYGFVVPKLCASGSECMSSLGGDFIPSVLGVLHLQRWGPLESELAFRLGYEWLWSRLTDGSATSTRAFHGPALGLELHALWPVSRLLHLGPFAGIGSGIFLRSTLSAPHVDSSRNVDGAELHVWPTLGVRAELAWQ
jgi:hypothetical protein